MTTSPTVPTEMKYGEREIEDGKLTTFPNPRIGRKYEIDITLPEFSCKCPFSGYPDYATIHVTYTPDEKVVELKAIKLYINSFRDRYISAEEELVAETSAVIMAARLDLLPRSLASSIEYIAFWETSLPVNNEDEAIQRVIHNVARATSYLSDALAGTRAPATTS